MTDTGWQKIETCPKVNGQKLLVWADGELGIWYQDAYYAEGGDGHEPGMSGWVDQEGIGRYDAPTHWMPLPEPPQAPQTTTKGPLQSAGSNAADAAAQAERGEEPR